MKAKSLCRALVMNRCEATEKDLRRCRLCGWLIECTKCCRIETSSDSLCQHCLAVVAR